MAYGTKYTIETTQPSLDQRIKVSIKERDYTGSETELDPGRNHVVIQYTPIGHYGGTVHWNMARSVCTVDFQDDTTGLLSEVLNGDDEQYQILVENDNTSVSEWSGFVINDSYRYNLYVPSISSIRATDRLEDLQNIAYAQSDGTLYGGRLNLVEVIAQCLDSTGLGLGMYTHMNWYPHIGTNDLTDDDDPMANLRVNQDNFVDGDGNPYSKFTVLQQILMRFQLQLFQAENKWCIFQRKRNVGIAGVDVFKVYAYTSAGVAEGTPTLNLPGRKEASVDTDSGSFLISPTATGTIPYGSVKSTYYHGNPFDQLFSDLSFEEGLRDTVGGTPLLDGAVIVGQSFIDFDGVTASVNIPADRYFTLAGDDTLYKLTVASLINGSGATTNSPTIEPKIQVAAADNTAITFHEDIGGWERFNSIHETALEGQNTTEEDSRALKLDVEFVPTASYTQWVRQRSKEDFAGTTGQRLKTGFSIKADGTGSESEVYFAFKMYVVGTSNTWYYKRTDSTWPTTDPGANEITMNGFGWLDEDWHRVDIVTGELNDGSNDIAGTLYIEFYEGREHDLTTNSQTVTYIYVDNVDEPVILQANGEPANEATQTYLTYIGNVNRSEPAVPTFIMGDGPTSGHISRLTVLDSTGAEQSITSNWSYLPVSSPSGISLDQYWGNQIIKEFGVTNRQINASLYTQETSTTPKPYHYMVIERPASTVQDDYAWLNLTWRPASRTNVLSGTFVQVNEQKNADQICTIDVKPNTALLGSIPIETGLPCDSLDTFNPPLELTSVWFNAEDVGGTAAPANGIYTFTAPGDVTSYPWFTNLTPWNDSLIHSATGDVMNQIKADKDEGYIFFRRTSNRYLHRADLDGSNVVSSTIPAHQLAVDRANKEIIVYNGSTNILRYDYNLSFIGSLYLRMGSDIGGIACDQSGDFIVFQELANDGDDDVIKLDLSDSSEELLTTFTSLTQANSVFNNRTVIDEAEDIVFLRIENNPGNIYSIDFSAPSSLNLVVSNVGLGLALDRVNQKIIYDDKDGNLKWCDYNGTNVETIYNGPSSLEISAIDAGMS